MQNSLVFLICACVIGPIPSPISRKGSCLYAKIMGGAKRVAPLGFPSVPPSTIYGATAHFPLLWYQISPCSWVSTKNFTIVIIIIIQNNYYYKSIVMALPSLFCFTWGPRITSCSILRISLPGSKSSKPDSSLEMGLSNTKCCSAISSTCPWLSAVAPA